MLLGDSASIFGKDDGARLVDQVLCISERKSVSRCI